MPMKTMKKCLLVKYAMVLSKNRIQNALIVVLSSKRRKKSLNKLAEDHLDLLAQGHPDQRKVGLLDHLVQGRPDQRREDHPEEGQRKVDLLDLPVQDHLDQRREVPLEVDRRKVGRLGQRREDRPKVDHPEVDRLDQRREDRPKVDRRKVDHLDLSVDLRIDEAFKCRAKPMILGISISPVHCDHHKLLQYRSSNQNLRKKGSIST
jgi:hypothetical protein